MTQKITDKREKILNAAEELFEANGFHATGIDAISTHAGVTKRTLYKHFSSKEGLIKAVLRRHQNKMMELMRNQVAKIESGSSKGLLSCFDFYQKWFSKPNFSGCIFIKTLNEFQQCSGQLFNIATQAKSELRNYLSEIAGKAGAKNPKLLAVQLQLIFEGSIIVAQCGGEDENLAIAREFAERTIAEALSR